MDQQAIVRVTFKQLSALKALVNWPLFSRTMGPSDAFSLILDASLKKPFHWLPQRMRIQILNTNVTYTKPASHSSVYIKREWSWDMEIRASIVADKLLNVLC